MIYQGKEIADKYYILHRFHEQDGVAGGIYDTREGAEAFLNTHLKAPRGVFGDDDYRRITERAYQVQDLYRKLYQIWDESANRLLATTASERVCQEALKENPHLKCEILIGAGPRCYPITYLDACRVLHYDALRPEFSAEDSALAQAAVSFYELNICAKAWNKIDGFRLPGRSYTPAFLREGNKCGIVTALNNPDMHALPGQFVFKTSLAAQLFGFVFQDLFNDILKVQPWNA